MHSRGADRLGPSRDAVALCRYCGFRAVGSLWVQRGGGAPKRNALAAHSRMVGKLLTHVKLAHPEVYASNTTDEADAAPRGGVKNDCFLHGPYDGSAVFCPTCEKEAGR